MELLYQSIILPINNFIWSKVLVYFLLCVGLYFGYMTRFVQFRFFFHMFTLLIHGTGKANREHSISSFQAFCIGVASRVGTGNLTGVALAIALGGPGAVFWMWIVALLGGASAFVESTLAQIYKVREGKRYRGGPAYYMQYALGQRWMGILFSLLLILSYGFIFNAVQSNTISNAFKESFHLDPLMTGICLAVASAAVIFGGVKRIAVATEIVVPVMAVAYILVALYVIIMHFSLIPHVLSLIIQSAFGIKQAAGGLLGGSLSITIQMGIKRGLFSNEAGMGSAPNAAATAEVTHPVKQGLIQALGVFSDTLLICTVTAFIILFADIYPTGELEGIQLTQQSLAHLVGGWGDYFIAVCVFLFAFSSIVGNYYYGETNLELMSKNKKWLIFYRLLVIFMVLFGSLQKVLFVWTTADLFMAMMALVNLVAIVLLGKVAFATLKDYEAQLRAGKDPVFYKENVALKGYVDCWEDRNKK